MAEKILTDEEIIDNLNKDSNFGIQFIIQNQPNLVIDRLKEAGYDKADTPVRAYELLTDLYKVDRDKVLTLLNNIPYNNEAENYTGGFDSVFVNVQPRTTEEGGINWGGVLSGIGGLFTGVGSVLGGSTMTTTQQQQQLLFQQQQQREFERQRRQRNAVTIGVIAFVVLIVIVLMYSKSKTQSKNR
jgi:hypothetical protein